MYLWPQPDLDLVEQPPRLPRLVEQFRIEGTIDTEDPYDTPVDRVDFENLIFTENDWFHWRPDRLSRGVQHDWEMYDEATAALRFRGASRCSVRRCSFRSLAGSAIRLDLSCDRNDISENKMTHIGGTAILAAGYGPGTKDANHYNRLCDNDISYVGESYWHAPGIFIWQSGHNEIRGNRIHHCPYSGIVIAGRITYIRTLHGPLTEPPQCHRTVRWNEIDPQVTDNCQIDWGTWYLRERYQHARFNRILDNDIGQVMLMIGDGNGIYISGAGRGTLIAGNLIRDNDSLCMNAAIRVDDDQHDVDIVGNVIHRSLGEGIMAKGRCCISDNLIVDLRDKHSSGARTDYLRGPLLANNRWSRGTQFRRNTVISTVPNQTVGTFGAESHLSSLVMNNNHYYGIFQSSWAESHFETSRRVGQERQSRSDTLAFAGSDGQELDHQAARISLAGYGVELSRSALRWMNDDHNEPLTVNLQPDFWPQPTIKRNDSHIDANE